MISSLRLEFGTVRQVSPNTIAEDKAGSGSANPSPVSIPAVPTNKSSEPNNANILNLSVQSGDVDHPRVDKEDTEKVENLFAGFKEKISTVGNDKNTPFVKSVNADLKSSPNEGAPTVGKFPFSVIVKSIHEAYSAFSSFIGPNGDQLERIAFSAISAISAGLRSLFPIVKEALTTLQDSHPVLAVISLTLATVHVAISLIATLIATRNFPTDLFETNETSVSENQPNDLKESLNLFLDEIGEKLNALQKLGLVGALGAVREWLMLSSAVVSLLAILPVVIKTIAPIISIPIAAIGAGAVNLVAAIIELVQGVTEYISLGIDLKKLKDSEAVMKNMGNYSQDELDKLIAKIKNKENELIASRVRIGKALCGIALSTASIVAGVFMITASVSVPVLPAILASLSVLTVAIYIVVTIAVRMNRLQEEAALESPPQVSEDSSGPLLTDSEEAENESESDNESKNKPASPPPLYV